MLIIKLLIWCIICFSLFFNTNITEQTITISICVINNQGQIAVHHAYLLFMSLLLVVYVYCKMPYIEMDGSWLQLKMTGSKHHSVKSVPFTKCVRTLSVINFYFCTLHLRNDFRSWHVDYNKSSGIKSSHMEGYHFIRRKVMKSQRSCLNTFQLS